MTMHFQNELDKLNRQVLTLCGLVEQNLGLAVRSIERNDAFIAQSVKDHDNPIDGLEVEIEEECLKLLALYQPVASDLRYVIAVTKLAHELERIGDLAVNIAKLAMRLHDKPAVAIPYDLKQMAHTTQMMLKQVIDALIARDAELAKTVWATDDRIDAMHESNYAAILHAIRDRPQHLEQWIAYLGVSSRIERLADHVTNVAKDVIYLIEGEIVRHRAKELLGTPPANGPGR